MFVLLTIDTATNDTGNQAQNQLLAIDLDLRTQTIHTASDANLYTSEGNEGR